MITRRNRSIVRPTDGLSPRQNQQLGVPSYMNGRSSAFIAIAPMASTTELYFSVVCCKKNSLGGFGGVFLA